ncbi:MAG: NAD-dependent DNA ligase LigA, partial [Dehalococcoidia bacterium]|nr:NAD-dependent DNA ligase LigA [Dehalococcoidia bacterium]
MHETLNETEIGQKINNLRISIRYHDHRYYVLNSPEIGDSQYDDLMHQLRKLEQDFPQFLDQDSPTQRISANVATSFSTVLHPEPLLSLSNVFTAGELQLWIDKALRQHPELETSFVLEPKIDGLAVSLVYENGKFVRGATRGNGQEGEDITANLRTIRGLPLTLTHSGAQKIPDRFEVRGEVYISKIEFTELNKRRAKQNSPLYVNLRNTAAGSLRNLDPKITARRNLSVFIYQLGWTESSHLFDSHRETIEWLTSLGFPTNPLLKTISDVDEIVDYCKNLEAERDSLNYDIDGVVIKINSLASQNSLGIVGREPRWATAWKFAAEQAITELRDIKLSVGRTGVLTPYAELVPVFVGGANISVATLHNLDHIQDLDLRVGDHIVVQRAGEVIPQILGPVLSQRPQTAVAFDMPLTCPDCQAPIVKKAAEAAHYCSNMNCQGRLARQVEHYVSRQALNIEGFGEERASLLVRNGCIKSLADIYLMQDKKTQILDFKNRLDRLRLIARKYGKNNDTKLVRYLKRIDQLDKFPGIREKWFQTLEGGLTESKTLPLHRLLIGLGIRHLGETTARLIAERFRTLASLRSASQEDILAITGIGEIVASSIYEWVHESNNQILMDKLISLNLNVEENQIAFGDTLTGHKIAITGTLTRWKRSEIQNLIRQQGGEVVASVSKNTTLLLAGDKKKKK